MLFSQMPCHLKAHFQEERFYLVVANKQAFIADSTAVFECDGPVQYCVVDLRTLWGTFLKVIGDRDTLTVSELSQMCRLHEATLDAWSIAGVLRPIGATFDWADCFAAVVGAVLSRKGIKPQILKKAARFIRTGEGVEVMGAAK